MVGRDGRSSGQAPRAAGRRRVITTVCGSAGRHGECSRGRIMRVPGRGVVPAALFLAALGSGCAAMESESEGGGAGGKADDLGPGADGFLAVTASSVAALGGDLAGVEPA